MGIKEILRSYEEKRKVSQLRLDEKKDNLYSAYPEFSQVDEQINKIAIDTSKAILSSNIKSLITLQNEIDFLKNKKLKLLASIGKPTEYLDMEYECSLCSDSGYINGSLCSCVKQKIIEEAYTSSNISNAKEDTFNTFDDSLYSNKPNPDKYGSDLSPQENINMIKNISLNFAENIGNSIQKNLFFSGGTGLRKNLFV